MVRSGRSAAVAFAVAIALGGCTTTQHEAQRERLDSARQRAALETTRVTVANPVVTPTTVAEVRADGRTAFVVSIRNRGHRWVTDLPISLGYTTAGGESVYLNSEANLDYFQAHLPPIRAGGSLTWVYTADRTVSSGVHLFARVGRKASAPARLTEMNVRIGLSYRYLPASRSVVVRLNNRTSVPQYELQVYAYAKRGGRYVGAANATVMDLGAGSRQSVRLRVVGRLSGRLHVEAVPTILQ